MPPEQGRSGFVLGLLVAIYTIHMMDRTVLGVLLEPIRREFDLSDSALGLLTGFGYAVPFAIAGIPLGMLVDRVNRTRFLAVIIAIWSLATAASGLTGGFATLLLARAVVGTSEAGAPPAMLSILSDTFPRRTRAAAINILYLGSSIGMVLGSLVGGYAAAAFGWRGALLIASAPGLALSLAVAVTLSEPARVSGESEAEPLAAVLRFMVRDTRLFMTVAAHILASMVLIGIGSWVPVLMTRSHGLPSAAAGVYSALAVGVPGCVGLVLGSALSGLYAAGREDRLLLLTSAAVAAMVPFGIAGALSGPVALAVACFGAASLAGGVFLGPVFGLCLGWAPPQSRGTVMAIIVVAANLVGAGLGPQFVGSVSDLLARLGDPRNLDHALAALVLCGLVPAWLFKSVYDRVARTA